MVSLSERGLGRKPPKTPPDDTNPAPRGVITWHSPAERNRLLDVWRLAVFAMFAEQPRCIRLAWVLANLFNARTGYAFASNGWLTKNTLLAENKLREALAALEQAGAIQRVWATHADGQKQRLIFPATGILPRPTVGQGGEPQQVGPQNLSTKRVRLPKTEHERALLAHDIAERRRSERQQGTSNGRDRSSDAALQPPPSKRTH
jgi:hypothetical protein